MAFRDSHSRMIRDRIGRVEKNAERILDILTLDGAREYEIRASLDLIQQIYLDLNTAKTRLIKLKGENP